ncbi:FAD-dependent oxidoreductase, partial [Pseudomonas aeruginosa]
MTSAWNVEWRRRRVPALAGQGWVLIVVGGGSSGAGILRDAARRGWRCLRLEQRDFAGGTSSRSSTMRHGGPRYIAKGQWR